MQISLKNRVVLVTGASRGIGAALARHLAQAHATVAVHYNRNQETAEELASRLGLGARAFQADLANLDACTALFQSVVDTYGRLDVLVNNAAVSLNMPFHLSPDEWEYHWNATMHINVRALEWLCRLSIAHFQAHGGGRLVNIASRAAFRGDQPDYMTYAASKGAVVALTRSIARGFGKDGITAFTLAPGFTRTDMAQDFIDTYGEAYALQGVALNRLTEPDDIAPLVVLLASGLADHATGSTIDINAASYVH